MDQKVTIIISAFVMLIVFSFFCYLANKKNPPYIEKRGNKDKPDFYIVKTIAAFKNGGCAYIGYTFVKKKNGKYRIKYSILDLFSIIFSVGVLEGLCIWMFVRYLINSVEPIDITSIIAAFFLFVFMAVLLVLLHISKIVAYVYFRKYIKRQKSYKTKS